MTLSVPVVEAPDVSALLNQFKQRSNALFAGAAENFQNAGFRQQSTQGPVYPQEGYADSMSQWGMPIEGQGGLGFGSMGGAMPQYSKDTEAVRNAYNNRLRELGVPEHVIEGNAWNVQDESGWVAHIEGDGGKSYGLNQWYADRKDALFAYAKKRGMDPSDPVMQANNWYREMMGPYRAAYDAAVKSGTAHGAADVILRKYEIPAAEHMRRRAAAYAARGNRQAISNPMAPIKAPQGVPQWGQFSMGIEAFGK